NQVLSPGDVIYVDPLDKDGGRYRLRQVPEISGAMLVMDPWTGRVLAMVGGFSYDISQFNRATQALRQPGSSFKPFVYMAALDSGFTPSTIVQDAPFVIDQGPGLPKWKPTNFEGKFLGAIPLRVAMEKSRNLATVRDRAPPPDPPDDREQGIDPSTAYQMVSILQGVVERGTGAIIGAALKRPLAGKTGTTNDSNDVWFIGFSPDLAVGIYVGFD